MRVPNPMSATLGYGVSSILIGPLIVIGGAAIVGNPSLDEAACDASLIRVNLAQLAVLFERLAATAMIIVGIGLLIWLLRSTIKQSRTLGIIGTVASTSLLALLMLIGYGFIVAQPILPCEVPLGLQVGP